MLLRFLSSRVSVLSSSSKLKTTSVTHANLSILTMFSLVSSEVVITFLTTNALSSLPVNFPFGSNFLVSYQQYLQRLPYLVLDVVTKHANNGNLLAPNQTNKVNPLLVYFVSCCDIHFKMFRYNPSANYQPNGGHYLQIMLEKDLCNQIIVVSSDDTFT